MALKRLCGRIAIVTASTDGIGYAIARRLAQEGAKVVISSRKNKNVEEAVQKLCDENLDVIGTTCHVSKPEDRKKLFEAANKLGGLDILVSNAGVNTEMCLVLDTSESSWDKVFDVNVKASFLLAKESLPLLRKSKSGRIIFVSSIGGLHFDQPFHEVGAYCVSKTTLIGLTKAAALQLAPENITVNSICPGIIQTKFSAAITSQETLKYIPLGRLGQPQDVSATAAFLASEDAAYITGENIVVGGGMSSRL
nr:dehydrogenase/reductase SDR family member 4-like [Leptinotarsa decemlineata]